MNRIIKFRGLRKNYNPEYKQGKWEYGNLLNECSIGEVGAYLDSYEYAEVIPDSVGQFTGVTDKNGKEIYEGDIVKDTEGRIEQVKYEPEYGAIFMPFDNSEWCFTDGEYCEVIGNIYENPDLLK